MSVGRDERETALIVAVPEASRVVDVWRDRTSRTKPSRGVPPHVTLLYPFVPADELRDEDVAALRELFAAAAPFAVELREPRRFPRALYLAPEPPEPFVALTRAIETRFHARHWGGRYETVIPHLTVAEGDDALLDGAEADVRDYLPLAFRVSEATLLEEVEPSSNRWRVRERFPLGA